MGLTVRGARAAGEPRLTLAPIPGEQPVQPAAMDPVLGRQLADGAALSQVRLDQVPPDVHTTTPSRWCRVCPDTSVADPLEPVTIRATDVVVGACPSFSV